jgi:hypothetical protein
MNGGDLYAVPTEYSLGAYESCGSRLQPFDLPKPLGRAQQEPAAHTTTELGLGIVFLAL